MALHNYSPCSTSFAQCLLNVVTADKKSGGIYWSTPNCCAGNCKTTLCTQEHKINLSAQIDLASAQVQPRAIGAARICVRKDDSGKTRLKTLRQSGSLKLVFPHSHGTEAEAILVNTAGGVTGGDQYSLDATVEPDASLTITTQAAERAYRAQPGETGRINTSLSVAQGATLNWLPQELILFERCSVARNLDIKLADGAQLTMVEPVVFGRSAMGERLRDISFQDRVTIHRNGVPLYIDGLRLKGDAVDHLANPTIANSAGAMASVVSIGAHVEALLAPIRAMLPHTGGASLIASDTLVLRLLASDAFELRRSLLPILERLTQASLPISWRL